MVKVTGIENRGRTATVLLRGSNVVWYGDLAADPIRKKRLAHGRIRGGAKGAGGR